MKTLRSIINFRLLLSLGLLVGLLIIVDWQTIVANILRVERGLYLLGLIFYLITMTLWAFRWFLLLRSVDRTLSVSYFRVLRATLIGNFYSLFLPKAVGTDVGRLYEIFTDQKPNAEVASTVLLDRIIGLISLVLMAVAALALGSGFAGDTALAIVIPGTLAVMIVGWLVFFNRRLMRRLQWIFRLPLLGRVEKLTRDLYQSLHLLQSKSGLVVTAIVVSVLMKSVEVFATVFAARALGIDTELRYFFIFLPIIWVIAMIPISISGLGLREGAFAFFFIQVGVSASDAVTVSLLYYSYNLLTGLMSGLLLLAHNIADLRRRRPEVEEGMKTT